MMRSSSLLRHLWTDRRGAAGAEMVFVLPILIALMFGCFELGRYFLDEHVVVKAVRDGARFAARQKFTNMPCGGASSVDATIKNVVRFGNTAGSGNPRLSYWTNAATITVSVACDTSGTYKGIYNGLVAGAPVVTVSASVPYTSLFGTLGFDTAGLALNAKSESAVMGI
jgi:Flp pilus assembly protein TadG